MAWHGSRWSRESNNLNTRSGSDYIAQGGGIAKQDAVARRICHPANPLLCDSARHNLLDNLVPPVRR